MASTNMQIEHDMTLWLTQQRTAMPADLKTHYSTFADLYDRKYAFPDTSTSVASTVLPSCCISHANGGDVSASLLSFPLLCLLPPTIIICDFEKKINPISLVRFLTNAARQLKDPKDALKFLDTQAEKLQDPATGSKEAFVLATMEAAHYRQMTGDLDGCKKSIDASEKLLDDLPSTEPVINAALSRFRQLLQVSLDDLSVQEKQERAYELSMSALLGENLYNFGELFNTGDMEGFEKICCTGDFLKQKLCLMTLIEAVFKRTKELRGRMTFFEISRETRSVA
ncbi:hypothetical protein BSLG_002418 [Batrachochytrium salamandrivorans]|nr:hypothetical protein BSLG_002418 [Batrachochytrium salamandrivorans]